MKARDSFISVVLVVLGVGSAIGQQRIISNTEFSNATVEARAKSLETTRRVTSIEQILVGGVVTETIERISESIPSDRSRTLIKTTQGDHVSEKEWIRLMNVEYVRENGEPWKKVDDSPFRRLEVIVGASRPPGTVQYQYSSVSSAVGAEPMPMYEIFIVKTSGLELPFQKRQTWIGSDGLIYREVLVNGKLHPLVETHRTETRYEYDPNIKIEAPIK